MGLLAAYTQWNVLWLSHEKRILKWLASVTRRQILQMLCFYFVFTVFSTGKTIYKLAHKRHIDTYFLISYGEISISFHLTCCQVADWSIQISLWLPSFLLHSLAVNYFQSEWPKSNREKLTSPFAPSFNNDLSTALPLPQSALVCPYFTVTIP